MQPPRLFVIHRRTDPAGRIADGVLWPDGAVSIHWPTDRPHTDQWLSIEDVVAAYSDGGNTRVIWPERGPVGKAS